MNVYTKRTSTAFYLLCSIGVFICGGIISPAIAKANNLNASKSISIQQKKEVSGIVTDENGQPMIGVVVTILGTTTGDITRANGEYSLNVATGETLQYSFIGYKKKEIKVGTESFIAVQLDVESVVGDEVVIVGYGSIKKVNLSGSVSAVNVEELTESRPITDMSSALAGIAAGVYVSSESQSPTNNGASSITVRGQGTLNNSAPLIIIDGVESSMNTVNPQDVATISVLKDASSSAIYGSRAANGVILITTKKGKAGSVRFDYNGYFSFESVDKSGLTLVSNYADYMELQNEAQVNSKRVPVFSQESIDTWRANENVPGMEYKYPNTDFFSIYGTAAAQKHTFSASGGSEKVTFYTSFDYLDNPGVIENLGYERFSLRSNVDAKVTEWLTIGTNLSGYMATSEPGGSPWGSNMAVPGMVFRHPDGRYGDTNNNEDESRGSDNPLAKLNTYNGDTNRNNFNSRMYATITPLEGLSIQGSYSLQYYNVYQFGRTVNFIDKWNFLTETVRSTGGGQTSVENSSSIELRNFMDGTVRYEKSFLGDKLDFSVMGGVSQEQWSEESFGATRLDLIDPSLTVIDGATGVFEAEGNRSDWAMRSFFGRLNLGWDNKYLIEVNLRSDGSSRFLESQRWGYFPSVSAAWRISQEDFMKSADWLTDLKLRASYGALGNNSVGNYDALSTYSPTNYVLNGVIVQGLSQTAIANAMLTWETTYVTNIGVDFGFFENQLTGTIEYFNKTTKDILIDLPAPKVHGNASIPKQNVGQVTNKGAEILLNWRGRIGTEFSYNIGGNFTYIKNNVDKFKGDISSFSSGSSTLILEGQPMNIHYMHSFDRIIETDADLAIVQNMLDNAPINTETGKKMTVFPFGTPEKGDILLKDINGDGIVNNDDREMTGTGSTPKFTYGISLGAAWKGFDFSMLIQGVSGIQSIYQDFRSFVSTARYGYQLNKDVADGRWYEGRNTPAEYPRILAYPDERNNKHSDFWLESRDFLKIKNISLGYTLPKSWTNSVKLDRLRVYGSLENFFTFSNWKGFDPEVQTIGYPAMRQAVIGVNISF